MNINFEIGKVIKVLRKTMNITQKDLSEKLGVSIQQVHKYENGIDNINAAMIYKICNIFDCDVSLFFPKIEPNKNDNIMLKVAEKKTEFDYQIDDKEKKINEQNDKENETSEALELLKKFFSLKKNDRMKVMQYLNSIVKQ